MLTRSFRLSVVPVCVLASVLLVSGCASKRGSSRYSRPAGSVLQNITPEPGLNTPSQDYNPPADGIPMAPGAPLDSDPPPPTRSTSDLPPAPPRDDFESAERPGRHSASFGPYTGYVTPASKSSDEPEPAL